jgi:hypothetical protein
MRAWHKVHTVYIASKNVIMTEWHKVHTVYIASKNVIARHRQLLITPPIGDATTRCHSSVGSLTCCIYIISKLLSVPGYRKSSQLYKMPK